MLARNTLTFRPTTSSFLLLHSFSTRSQLSDSNCLESIGLLSYYSSHLRTTFAVTRHPRPNNNITTNMATPAAPQQAAPEPAPAPVADNKVVSTATSDTESGGQTAPKPARTITQRLSEELDVSKAFIPMLVCCFLSGLTDGTIYNG